MSGQVADLTREEGAGDGETVWLGRSNELRAGDPRSNSLEDLKIRRVEGGESTQYRFLNDPEEPFFHAFFSR